MLSKLMTWSKAITNAESRQHLGEYKDAIGLCNIALVLAQTNGTKQEEAQTRYLLGGLHMDYEHYEEAVVCFEKGLPVVQETGDKELKWHMYMGLAFSKKRLGQYKEGIQNCNKALQIFAQINGLKQEEMKTLGLLGDLYNYNEQYQEAIDCYQKGLSLAQETGDKKQEHEMCIGLGEPYRELGHIRVSMEYSEKALHIANNAGDSDMIVKSYFNLGIAFLSKCDYQNAIKYLNKAIDIFKQPGNYSENDLAPCYGNIATVYRQQGKYHDAIRFQKECLEIAVNSNDEELQGKTLLNLGNIHMNLNNYKKALEVYQESLAIAERISNKAIQKTCYGNLAGVYVESSYYQEADSMYRKSLEITKELGDIKFEATVISNIGRIYHRKKEFEHALQCFNESLSITKDIDAKDLDASVYLDIGRIHFDTEKFEEAISMFETSLDISSSIGDKEDEWRTCSELGRTYYSLSHQSHDQKEHMYCLSKSEEYLRQALRCYDYLFTHLRHHDQFKISKFDQFTKTYNLLTNVLIETKQTEEALLILDQGRARALTDLLKLQYGMSQSEDLSSKPLTYPDVESVVSNDAFTILHYSLLNESLVVWILSKESIKFKELDKKEFDSAIESLYMKQTKTEDIQKEDEVTCENRSLDDYMTPIEQQCDGETESVTRASNSGDELNVHALEVLYNTLIAPVISDVQHDEIVIVPDGKMYTIPFAALKVRPNTGKYLSESKRIRLVPSITVLKLLQECPADHVTKRGALIVGNPMGKRDNLRGNEGFLVKFRRKEVFWKTLNHARKEACEVFIEISGDVHTNIKLFTEEQATKDVVLEKMKEENGVIHIAAHGDAKFGEIVLAPITSQDRQGLPEEQNYLLTMTEVQKVGVKAQLVVLSCCHSGRGEIRAEGMIGLSRAFIAAGARAVIASLWAIDSKATRKFMVGFYKCLCHGYSASVSLKKAMKHLRKEYSEPKYWAPFVLIGDDVTIKFGH